MKSKKNIFLFYIVLVFITFIGFSLFIGCKQKNNNIHTPTGNIKTDGENLVQINCTKCHKLVPVNAITKNVWLYHTLPTMARYFKIATYGRTQYFKNNPLDTSGISLKDWNTIVSYYEKIAPDSLVSAKVPIPLVNNWAGFSLKKPNKVRIPVHTTMVKFNKDLRQIFT
jgi:hypothetical protein